MDFRLQKTRGSAALHVAGRNDQTHSSLKSLTAHVKDKCPGTVTKRRFVAL